MNERMAEATPGHPTLRRLDARLAAPCFSAPRPRPPPTLSLPTTLCLLPLLPPLRLAPHVQLSSGKGCLLTVCVFQDF